MVKDELRKLLNQPYKSENWKKITDFVFPNVSYLQKPLEIPFESDKVESFKQIGNVKLSDGKNLAMFEVHVAENVNLASNRVELRKLVAPLIDQERNHGVLVIYEQGKEDYRFTFTAKSTEFDETEGDFKNIETDAKRFTYILGKNESCKTAANRFWELSGNKDKATIKDVEEAFSVERLNKEFFDKYKSFYEDFVQHITGKRFEKEKGKWVEKTKGKAILEHKTVFGSDDKLARNFVKLLLGRLVFIQFLQKKGWMGVPSENKKWKNGEKDFISKLFSSFKNKEKFHSDLLHELFYKAFNTPNRPNDIFPLTGTRVPYLNGGLFENEYSKTELINFPSNYFQDLFDFFSQYNFTIDENDPMDHEVGIDPEMLGHIFENLLEDNKDKGAFYTPKPIVQYMCQESLIQYLKTYLIDHKQWPSDEKKAIELYDCLQNFVRKKTASAIIDLDEFIATALRDVKICDPAIGSGAFPMGLLNEIFYCIQVLYNASPDVVGEIWKMSSWQADIVKKNIIQHSIYGVDLEKGAVDIARLRFWLSLIVDEKEPYPLPNLDFKIIQGNSLLESFKGIDLSKIANSRIEVSNVQVDLFGKVVDAQATIFDTSLIDDSNITELIDSYFSAQLPNKKQELKLQIDSIIHRHIDFNLTSIEKDITSNISELEFKIKGNEIKPNDTKGVEERKKEALEKLNKELIKAQLSLKEMGSKKKQLHDFQNTTERPYFLWHLFFKDIFDVGGFDIMIANPPYVGQKGHKEMFQEIKNSELGRKYHQRRMDLFYFFFHQGIINLKQSGILTFITTNYYLTATYSDKLRKHIYDEATILSLVNFNELKIFESAQGQHNLITVLKKGKYPDEIAKTSSTRRKGFNGENVISKIIHEQDSETEYNRQSQESLFEKSTLYIRIESEKKSKGGKDNIFDVLNKIRIGSELLSTYCEIEQGIVSGADKVSDSHTMEYPQSNFKKGKGIYILTNSEVKELNFSKEDKLSLKKTYKNSEIKKWVVTPNNNLNVIYIKSYGEYVEPSPGIKKHLDLYKIILINRNVRVGSITEKDYSDFLQDKKDISYIMNASSMKKGNYYCLSYARRALKTFEVPKIVNSRRAHSNTFALEENGYYEQSDIVITTLKPEYEKNVDIKFFLAILNSKLIYTWLYHKGKRKGEQLELFQKPLSEVPIKIGEKAVQKKIVRLVENILNAKKKDSDADTIEFESEINVIVYKLYDLSFEDIKIIEPDFKMAKEDFINYK